MTDKSEDLKKSEQQSNLRPYHVPSLLAYGAVRELTRSGLGSKVENTGMDIQPFKRP